MSAKVLQKTDSHENGIEKRVLNIPSGCVSTAFVYDVTLNISIEGETLRDLYKVIKPSTAAFVGHIVHTYKNWNIAANIITRHLSNELLTIMPRIDVTQWETTVHAKGYHHLDETTDNLYIVNDDNISFNEDMRPQQSIYISNPAHYAINLKYSGNVYLCPAFESQRYYMEQGYEIQCGISPNIELDFRQVAHFINFEGEYNCAEMWEASLIHYLSSRRNRYC